MQRQQSHFHFSSASSFHYSVTMGQCQSANIKGLLKTAIWAPVPAASRICALPIVCASINHVIGDGDDNSTMGRFLLENTIETEVVTPSDYYSLIPIQSSDIWGFTSAALVLIVASGGGIGGGGMLVPIYILVWASCRNMLFQ